MRSTAARVWLLSSWDPANMDWVLQHTDNPGTERFAFSQMFTPPHSSHLPHSPESLAALLASLTHKLTALGFSALISFLFSPGTEAVLRSIMLFLSSHSLLALIPSDMLAVDVPSWPTTFPSCLQHLREHSSRGNVILLCTRWSRYYWVFLLPLPSAGFGTSCGSSAGFPLSITSPHGDGSAPGFSPHGSSSWPWHVSVKHHSLANPTPWCLSDTSAPLSRCCPSDRTSLILLCTSIFSSHTAGCVLSCTTPQLKVTL